MLRVDHIYKKIGDFKLEDISFEVEKGEYFVLLGPTGSGKTVLLEAIAGINNIDKGSIYFYDKNITTFPPEQRNVGFVYQDYLLFPHLTVKENIMFGLKAKKIDKDSMGKIISEVTVMLEINHLLNRSSVTLSGGEQQRVAFARAIVTSPKLLLLDEVSSALDPCTKEIFQCNLKKYHKKIKTTTIHVTHDFNEAKYLADKIAVIGNGKIYQIGTPNEIFNHPNSDFVANFTCYSSLVKSKAYNCKETYKYKISNENIIHL